jgi:hypothetical protein
MRLLAAAASAQLTGCDIHLERAKDEVFQYSDWVAIDCL